MAKRHPSKRYSITPRKRKYARERAKGKTQKKAAVAAGYTSKRARLGKTGAELERDPRVLELMRRYAEASDVSEQELTDRLGAQVRGLMPTRMIRKGSKSEEHFETHKAIETDLRRRGLLNGDQPPPPPSGSGVAGLTHLSDDDLRLIVEGRAPAPRPDAAGDKHTAGGAE